MSIGSKIGIATCVSLASRVAAPSAIQLCCNIFRIQRQASAIFCSAVGAGLWEISAC
jgi:hypothetical protein